MNQNIGIHIRLNQSFTNTIDKAIRLNVPFFQTFFTLPSGKHINLEYEDIKKFSLLKNKYFKKLYAHGSYWINLCNGNSISYKILQKEIFIAKKLGFTHLIIHPGSATGCKSKIEGIDNLANSLNNILKKENDINIVLENTAHSNLSVGGDLKDFNVLLNKIDQPDKISFCIDTAHAYCFGYNIADNEEQDKFISLIDKTIGKNKIELIHLNDTCENLGLKIDKHDIPGQGKIGEEALKRFITHDDFINLPKIIETPILTEEEEISILEKIKKWI